MKRHSDNNDHYSSGKRSRSGSDMSGKYEIRILIQSKNAGGVIGKAGANIKRLRSEFNATLTVPDSNSPERVLTVVAELENALQCVAEILPKLDESKGARDELEMRMLVHQSHAGAIIGRAGFKIKELREKTKTHLKVYSECCPMSSDRVLEISGELDQIIEAIRAVNDLLSDIPVKGSTKPYDTINYDPGMVQDYGGFGSERGYRGSGGASQGRGYGGGGGGGGRYGGGGGRGPMGGGGGGRYGGGPPMDYGMGGGRGRGGGDFGGPPPPMMAQPGGPMHTTQVTVPAELGGTIIGKGGERINRIREDSGAHIVVDPPASGSDERVITISGTQYQIQMAQHLLQNCVRSSVAGRKYIQQQQNR